MSALKELPKSLLSTEKGMFKTSSGKIFFLFKDNFKRYDEPEGYTGYTLDQFELSIQIDDELINRLIDASNNSTRSVILVHNSHRIVLDSKDCLEVVTYVTERIEYEKTLG